MKKEICNQIHTGMLHNIFSILKIAMHIITLKAVRNPESLRSKESFLSKFQLLWPQEAFCTYIPILSHSHFLCKVFSTKLFKSQQLLLFHVFMKETETHASVHYSWSDSMSSLSDFLVNIYFPFCVPYGSVPDLTVMSWASVSLHYPALCQDIILLNP